MCLHVVFCVLKTDTRIWNWMPHYWHSLRETQKHDVRFPFTQLMCWQSRVCGHKSFSNKFINSCEMEKRKSQLNEGCLPGDMCCICYSKNNSKRIRFMTIGERKFFIWSDKVSAVFKSTREIKTRVSKNVKSAKTVQLLKSWAVQAIKKRCRWHPENGDFWSFITI